MDLQGKTAIVTGSGRGIPVYDAFTPTHWCQGNHQKQENA